MDTFTLQALAILLLSLATFAYLSLHRKQPPRTAAPPSPPRLPVIGHLHLLTDMPHHSFAKIARKLGPIFGLRLGRVDSVVISSDRLAESVLKTHDHVFASRPQLLAAQYLSFGCSDVTFSPYGPYWRQARKVCVSELLSPKRVNSFRLIRDDEVSHLISSVLARAQSGSELDLSRLFFNLANDILCRVAFGKRFMTESREGRRKHELVNVLTETQALLAGFCVGDFFPDWGWVNSVSGMKRRLERNLKDLREVYNEIIKKHLEKRVSKGGEKLLENDKNKQDFVDVLLRVQERDDLEVPISDDNLKALVLDMFVAGTDTTSSTLEWTMTLLAKHPDIMKKAQDEVRRIGSNKEKIEEDDLSNLPYLKAVIKETMRINPPVPLLVPRESMENIVLDGYEIPARTRVLINTYAIGRDPDSWQDPLAFRPERFLENEIDFKGQDFRFLPFGGGRRGCPGHAFGLATVEICLARILYHFDWELPEGVGVDDLDMEEVFGLATRKKSALILVPKIAEKAS